MCQDCIHKYDFGILSDCYLCIRGRKNNFESNLKKGEMKK